LSYLWTMLNVNASMVHREMEKKRKEKKEWLLYAHRHRHILGAPGHIILTPVNHLLAMGANNMVTVQSGIH
jgi:hypothetical protein